jgi:hypothetical protein
MRKLGAAILLSLVVLPCTAAERTTMSLDGNWDIADSVSATEIPTVFTHTAPVPGLAHSARTAFADVDLFDSQEVIANRISKGELPESAMVKGAGVAHQNRNYFWYRTTFVPPGRRALVLLKINKAQFGSAVWLNGRKIGEHWGCFTASIFNISDVIRWDDKNELLVRVGAHPGVLPETVSGGTDFEKNRWTPGIYDSVSLLLSDNPAIESVQVAPRIQTSEIVVQAKLRNYGATSASFAVTFNVKAWKRTQPVARAESRRILLKPAEARTITQTIRIPGAKLWTPEQPNLYVVGTSTGGDSATTRFGMREFRFDTPTRRAYLNGKPYFMRGSNITLHRFFEDPQSGALPWNDEWVRKLLIDIPKKMSWNSFRFCIGPVPDRWLDIADEAGLLIQNEYFVWTGRDWFKGYEKKFDTDEMITEYGEWMRDNWNHPSVVIWDANNETWNPDFATKIIPAVRSLDLSNRPWENSYNGPVGPDDPVEDHPYEQHIITSTGDFEMKELESRSGAGDTGSATGHAMILNEYGWLWLNRDGSPTELTGAVYEKLLGPSASAEDRFALDAYLLAGLTEFWRAHRMYAGVLHFVYLTAGGPGVFTCDHFRNLERLELEPHFEDYVSQAFRPLGVYLNFWHPTIEAGSKQMFTVMMVNDGDRPITGSLALVIEDQKGEALARQSVPFSLAALGQQTYFVDLTIPMGVEKCLLKAIARPEGGAEPTLSRRRVDLVVMSAPK